MGTRFHTGPFSHRFAAQLMVAPVVAYYLVFAMYPLAFMFYMSMTDARPLRGTPVRFIGVENWLRLPEDPLFVDSVFNTVVIIIPAVALEFLLGLGLALLLHKQLRGEPVIRTMVIIPMMLPPIVAGVIWDLFFSANFGLLNYVTSVLGLGRVGWLGTPWTARLAIIVVDLWQWTPFVFLVLLAGLRSIPDYLYEAANIDGLNQPQVFRRVTWPMLRSVVTVVLMIRLIDALKIFDTLFVLTRGGPAFSTSITMYYTYLAAFPFGLLGYASSMAVVLFAASLLLAVLIMKLIRLERHLGWVQ